LGCPYSNSPSNSPSDSNNPSTEGISVYANDFESPKWAVQVNCPNNLDLTDVNTLYGRGAGGTFAQVGTVETVSINTEWMAGTPYVDTANTGGEYAIGMFSFPDDLLALGFDTSGKNYVNVAMDISAIC
jgi:hypothetical protein